MRPLGYVSFGFGILWFEALDVAILYEFAGLQHCPRKMVQYLQDNCNALLDHGVLICQI